MKKLFFATSLFVFGALSAQENQVPGLQKRIDSFLQDRSEKASAKPLSRRHTFTQEQLRTQLKTIISTNGSDIVENQTVVILPQDNMPSIVPSMRDYNMPNAWTGELKTSGSGVIPNPGRTIKLAVPPIKTTRMPDIKIRVSPYNTLPTLNNPFDK